MLVLPAYVAADLLKAEHGPDGQVILVTTDILEKVQKEIKQQLAVLPEKKLQKKPCFKMIAFASQSAIDF